MSDTRSAFEAWARAQNPDIDYELHGFDPYERAAWQAACEACAKACSGNESFGGGSWSHGYTHAVENCADACRALAKP